MQQLSNELFNEAASIGDQILVPMPEQLGTGEAAWRTVSAGVPCVESQILAFSDLCAATIGHGNNSPVRIPPDSAGMRAERAEEVLLSSGGPC